MPIRENNLKKNTIWRVKKRHK